MRLGDLQMAVAEVYQEDVNEPFQKPQEGSNRPDYGYNAPLQEVETWRKQGGVQ